MFPTKSILVATDLTESCEPALAAARDLALLGDAALHVIHAFELRGNPYVYRPDARHAFQALLQEAREGLAAQLESTLGARFVPASVATEVYLPWKAIIQRAKTVQAELIVLGPHEHIAGDRLLGSTADRVVRHARVPSLIVKRGPALSARRMVVAIDGSPPTVAAWTEALSWAAALEQTPMSSEEIHFVLSAADWYDQVAGQDLLELARHEAGEYLREAPIKVHAQMLTGDDPASDILSYVDRIGADLLVVATSGHGSVDRVLTGSVSAELGAKASCALLVASVDSEPHARALDLLRWHLPMAMV